jgi:hypothetical protein
MSGQAGRSLPLTTPRRLICDLLHFARKIPTVPVQRWIDVGELAEARLRLEYRPGWCALFTKAYALVAAQVPALRRAYLPFPRPRLYEHPCSVASVAVERLYEGEPAVFFGHLRCPEQLTLADVDCHLRHFREAPVESVGGFRRALRISRLPRPLRRLAWRVGLHCSGPTRARYLGTFGVSVYSALGAESLHPLSPLTTTLNYGVIGPDGRVPVRVVYDHRVLDGATVARALGRLQEVLAHDLPAELRQQAAGQAA